jgi:hypothetical protein
MDDMDLLEKLRQLPIFTMSEAAIRARTDLAERLLDAMRRPTPPPYWALIETRAT